MFANILCGDTVIERINAIDYRSDYAFRKESKKILQEYLNLGYPFTLKFYSTKSAKVRN